MSWLLSEPNKPYIDAAKTDVMRTWRKHGFVPPSEVKTSPKETMSGIRYYGDIEASESKFNFLTESQDREQRNDHKEMHQVQRNKTA